MLHALVECLCGNFAIVVLLGLWLLAGVWFACFAACWLSRLVCFILDCCAGSCCLDGCLTLVV